MPHQEFKLSAGSEYIPLDKLLKMTGLVGTGGEAHIVVSEGLVSVNSDVETRKRRKIRAQDVVEFNGESITVLK